MKGLSFSEPMVKAWMEGRKTVTRRLMNPQPCQSFEGPYQDKDGRWVMCENNPPHILRTFPLKPRYLPGEIVYIKEMWHCDDPAAAQDAMSRGEGLYYKAGMAEQEASMFKWKSPRFMPERASRSHARIVSVIPERIQEINEIDAYLEGFRDQLRGETFWPAGAQFKEIWDKLHLGSWERNDWVWRIELEKNP
jgi:hypothetical protein